MDELMRQIEDHIEVVRYGIEDPSTLLTRTYLLFRLGQASGQLEVYADYADDEDYEEIAAAEEEISDLHDELIEHFEARETR